MMIEERFLRYVSVWTTSNEASGTVPSEARELALAELLARELKELGAEDAAVDEYGYVYAHIPASEGLEHTPAVAWIAHMDTAPDFAGENVRPQVIRNYDGGDVTLGSSGRVLSVRDFPHLESLKGRTLITTDGTTLLGADDKAGVAEIMTAAERILGEGIPHGKICIAFTPDEEIGRGPDHFDLQRLGADYGYTMDGGYEGEIQYENFNAASAIVRIHGINVHPGEAKNIMVNAVLLGMEFNDGLPASERPEYTEGYEGFFHLTDMSGTVEKAELRYLIRDHDEQRFIRRVEQLEDIRDSMNRAYGAGTVELIVEQSYRNMRERILPHMELIACAKEAMEAAGVEAREEPIRGGTDGARLSFMGLPCPNLGTGGYAYHGPFEHVTAEGMRAAAEVILQIVRNMANRA